MMHTRELQGYCQVMEEVVKEDRFMITTRKESLVWEHGVRLCVCLYSEHVIRIG